MEITPATCRAARALLGLDQGPLADAARISRATLSGFEAGKTRFQATTAMALQRALEDRGIEFLPDGVRLRTKSGD